MDASGCDVIISKHRRQVRAWAGFGGLDIYREKPLPFLHLPVLSLEALKRLLGDSEDLDSCLIGIGGPKQRIPRTLHPEAREEK